MANDVSSIKTRNGVHTVSVSMGACTLTLECDKLDEEYKQIARDELRETPEVVRDSMEQFKKLLKEEEGLSVPYEEEWFLYHFLRPCKFYPESAMERCRNYFMFKVKYPKLCAQKLLPSLNKNIFQQNLLTILPRRDQHGRRVVVLECGKKWKPKKCSTDEIIRGVMIMLEAALTEPHTQIAGAVMIWDTEGLAMEHAMQLSPSFAKMILTWIQDCIPIRVKGFHMINQSTVFKMAFSIFKPFIGSKLRSRMFFHGHDRKSLMKHIDADTLPTKYGGNCEMEDVPWESMYDLFASFESAYEEGSEYGYNSKTKI